nr:S1 domain containing protein [Haemonchus contortus]
MSVSTKRRYITNKVESEYYTPVEGDIIAQVRNARGNNLHEVEDENGETYVASMPSKFRKAIWIRRGQFVVLRPIEEGDKVKAEIEHVLDEENILYIRSINKWPARFEEQARMMTRDAKRGGKGEDTMIDDDMLPPTDSDEYESDEEQSDDEDEDDVSANNSDDDNHELNLPQYNPNRDKAPTST